MAPGSRRWSCDLSYADGWGGAGGFKRTGDVASCGKNKVYSFRVTPMRGRRRDYNERHFIINGHLQYHDIII